MAATETAFSFIGSYAKNDLVAIRHTDGAGSWWLTDLQGDRIGPFHPHRVGPLLDARRMFGRIYR
jgi:hypothetical protein